jgi:hypothetical protein
MPKMGRKKAEKVQSRPLAVQKKVEEVRKEEKVGRTKGSKGYLLEVEAWFRVNKNPPKKSCKA